jgi:hypothetical protein
MKTCGNNGDCRTEYSCVFPDTITQSGGWDPNLPLEERTARIIDLEGNRADSKICVALTPGVVPDVPGLGTELDAGI